MKSYPQSTRVKRLGRPWRSPARMHLVVESLDDVLKRVSLYQRTRFVKGHQMAVDVEKHFTLVGNGTGAARVVTETTKVGQKIAFAHAESYHRVGASIYS
jgi:hypothetical protein